MNITTKRGQEFHIEDSHWDALERRYGARAREMALTFLCRREGHRQVAAEEQITEEAIASEVETQRLIAQAERYYADRPSRYKAGEVMIRVLQGRIMSAGMMAELIEIQGVDVSDIDLRGQAIAKLEQDRAFRSRLANTSMERFYSL